MQHDAIDQYYRHRFADDDRHDDETCDELIPERRPWPAALDAEAFHGLAGDIVRTIEPHTEADPAALLAHVLVGFGSMIGRTAHYTVEDTAHYANESVVLVGRSSKARKGTAEARIRRLLRVVDEGWNRDCIASGLSSGEGLIWSVRDPIVHREQDRRTGEHKDVLADAGVEDKRLLVVEAEFASTLRVLGREGSTLSPMLRRAWDDGNLRSLTKSSPARATGAHISVMAHITDPELRRYLDSTEAANGFANRFLFLCVKRSKLLPFGGRMASLNVGPMLERLRRAVDHARAVGEVRFDAEAAQAWERVYAELSAERDGLVGAVTARAEAHVVRLALVYAMLDCAAAIHAEHLLAALAVWRYAEDSARYVFGNALGDRIADGILEALRRAPAGLTRTEIRDLFGRHASRARVTDALDTLLRHGLVRREIEQTSGRPIERWFAVSGGAYVA